jgi:hypothetical protein
MMIRVPGPEHINPLPVPPIEAPIACWKPSASAALVGFGGRADAATRLRERQLGRLLRLCCVSERDERLRSRLSSVRRIADFRTVLLAGRWF